MFSAALLLPVTLVIALLALLRGQRYLIARKHPSTFIATSAFIGLSALGAFVVARVTPVHAWLTPDRTNSIPPSAVTLTLAMSGAVVVYFGVQAALIAVSRVLISGNWSLDTLLGSRADNVLEVHTLLIGVFAAVVGAFAMPALFAVTAVASYSTLAEQRLSQLQHEREQLEVDALHDPLTGLPNRRGFEPQAELAMVTGQATRRPSAVLMADLDHFKNWNTKLGHFGADQVLTSVARVLRDNTRKTDLLCRWGGEELLIVMPETHRREAAMLAERLRAAVEALRIEVTKPAGGQSTTVTGITVSIGVAMVPDVGTDLAPAQEAADHALQVAKDSGRNQVRFAGPAATTAISA
ncbi:MAG: GGDEF domain-containing protein [Sciscionella sp.]